MPTHTKQSQEVPSMVIRTGVPNGEKTVRGVCAQLIPPKNDRNLRREIDELKRKLRHARRERSPPCFEPSSEETDGASYRRRSRTPPNETFSYEEEHSHWHRYKNPPSRGLGNSAINKALSQVSKSPFTRNIEDAILPRRFHQPTFTLYDG